MSGRSHHAKFFFAFSRNSITRILIDLVRTNMTNVLFSWLLDSFLFLDFWLSQLLFNDFYFLFFLFFFPFLYKMLRFSSSSFLFVFVICFWMFVMKIGRRTIREAVTGIFLLFDTKSETKMILKENWLEWKRNKRICETCVSKNLTYTRRNI